MVALAKRSDLPSPAVEPVIDAEHLSRMTLGELDLEREVLQLFCRQVDLLLPRMRRGNPDLAAASAHTLKGSASGIGAFRVARAAAAVEKASASDTKTAEAIATLADMLVEAKIEISRLLATRP
jgi:HPt (histidine-containing phosphotransfer) domain-containing protein